jgi:hypothetical protein
MKVGALRGGGFSFERISYVCTARVVIGILEVRAVNYASLDPSSIGLPVNEDIFVVGR